MCEREREREKKKEKDREGKREKDKDKKERVVIEKSGYISLFISLILADSQTLKYIEALRS